MNAKKEQFSREETHEERRCEFRELLSDFVGNIETVSQSLREADVGEHDQIPVAITALREAAKAFYEVAEFTMNEEIIASARILLSWGPLYNDEPTFPLLHTSPSP
jgi:hypothetical protein